MADDTVQLTVRINSETGQLEVVNQKLGEATKSAKSAESSFLGLSGSAASLAKSIGLVFGASQIISFFKSSVAEAEEENEALRRLKFNLEATGQSWDKNSTQVKNWADQIQESTRFSDTVALKTLERFVRVTDNLSQAQAASRLAMNLSVSTGKELSQVQELLVNLVNGNARALIEAKREFGAFVGQAKSAQEVLDILTNKFKGAAEAEESLTKKQKQLENSWNQLKENFGKLVEPSLTSFIDLLNKSVEGYVRLSEIISRKAVTGEQAKAIMGDLDINKNLEFFKKLNDVKTQQNVEQKKEEVRLVAKVSEEQLEAERQAIQDRLQGVIDASRKERKEWEDYYEWRKAEEKELNAALEKDRQENIKKEEKIALATQKIYAEVARSMSQNFSDAFAKTLVEGKNFGDQLDNIFKNLAETIISTITQALILRTVLGGVGGGGAGFLPIFGASGSPSMPRYNQVPPGPISLNPSTVRAFAANVRVTQSFESKPNAY